MDSSQQSISSEQENNLLEQQEDSGDTIRIEKVLESQKPFQQLYRLDCSSQLSDDLLEDMNIQQAQNTPLPPPTPSEFWTEEEKLVLEKNKIYFLEMITKCLSTRGKNQKF